MPKKENNNERSLAALIAELAKTLRKKAQEVQSAPNFKKKTSQSLEASVRKLALILREYAQASTKKSQTTKSKALQRATKKRTTASKNSKKQKSSNKKKLLKNFRNLMKG